MRPTLILLAAALGVINASPLRSSGIHVEIPRDLPPGTRIMDAAAIAEADFGDEEPVIFAPAPTHTLSPSIHHDHDTSDYNHLNPHPTKNLYFAQGRTHSKPMYEAQFLHAETTFKYPAIVLEHSCHISATISGNHMTVKFKNKEAFERVRSVWADASPESPIIIITTTGSRDGHFVYYLVTEVNCDDLTWSCFLHANVADFDDIVEGFDLSWGSVDHPNAKRAPADSKIEARQASGTSFDEDLDAALGYLSFSPDSFKADLQDFAEGLTDFNYADYNDVNADVDGIYADDGSIEFGVDPNANYFDSGSEIQGVKRSLQKRRGRSRLAAFVGAIKEKTIDKAASLINKAKDKVVDFAQKKIIEPVKKAISYIDGTPHDFKWKKDFNKPETGDMTSNNKYKSLPFWKDETGRVRSARELYEKKSGNLNFAVYCVDCNVIGNVQISGQVAFHLTKGLQKGSVSLVGGLNAGLGIGILAGYTLQQQNNVRIFTAGIPGITVPNFINIGPMLTVDAIYGYNLAITGSFLVGGRLYLNNLDATVDLMNSANSKKPELKPEFKPYFQANGQLTANMYAGLSAGIAIGLDIANGKISAGVVVQSEPKFNAQFTASAQTGSANTGGTCTGIGLGLSIEHSLFAAARYKIPLIGEKSTDKYKFINDFSVPVGKRCFNPSATKRQTDGGFSDDGSNAGLFSDLVDSNYTLQEVTPGSQEGEDPFALFESYEQQAYQWPAPVAAIIEGKGPKYSSSVNTPDSDETGTSFNYTVIMDSGAQYILASTDTGNIGVQSADDNLEGENLFEVYEGAVIGDSFGRTLVFYEKELQTHSVSRLRLVEPEKVPISSSIVGLFPIPDGNTIQSSVDGTIPEAFLVGIDTIGTIVWPVLCNYADGLTPSKLFVVADPTTGPQKLLDPALVTVLTGGQLESCQAIGLLDGMSV